MKEQRVILNSQHLDLTIRRLAHQLIENHDDFSDTVLIGLQPRGVLLLERLLQILEAELGHRPQCGNLDITFYRDDFRRRDKPIIPSVTNIDFIIENKKVILVDDVLYTGRSIRSGLDALLAFGRPDIVELLILIDRRFKRQLPIQPNYTGKAVDSLISEKVAVKWGVENPSDDQVILYTPEDDE